MRGLHLPLMEMPAASRHGMPPAAQGLGWFSVLRISLPILVISLLVLLGVWIGKSSQPTIINQITAAPPPPAEPVCAACGKPLEVEWIVCPYCGNHR